MNDLLLQSSTRLQADLFLKKPSHALLLTGDVGSGKACLAETLARELLGCSSIQQLRQYPYFTHLKRPDGKQDIPIDSIRGVGKLLKLKTPGSREIRRVILIEDAQDLNEEASNALLKMLEEPAADCVFILTAPSVHSVLPTISSRAQQLQIRPTSLGQSLKFLDGKYLKYDIESAWRLSGGTAGLMLAILHDDKDHPLKRAVDEAKQYLRKNRYERALLTASLSRNKKQLSLLLEALVKLLGAVQHSGSRAGSDSQQKKLLASRKLVLKLQRAQEANVSPKLIALELSLNLL
ncbi:MAG: AAA family ATPase [Patescibacteria group bacterium]